MKVIYEFYPDDEEGNDGFELLLVQNAFKMYSALSDIKEYIRQINKGWNEDTVDQITDKIGNIIHDSNLYLIEGI